MKYLILLIVVLQVSNTKNYTVNFGKKNTENWYVVNDVVMGGRSTGTISTNKKSVSFNGLLSLENNGGFASIRSSYEKYDLSNYNKVKIKYKAEGKQFAFLLELSEYWYKPYYKYYLNNTNEKWQEVEIDLEKFESYQIGQPNGEKLTKNKLSKIIRLGFMTTEKQPGPFNLEIDYIQFY